MNKIICIEIEPYGLIGFAKNYNHAIRWLIRHNYLNSSSPIEQEQEQDFKTPFQIFGENWKEEILKLSIEEFNDLFYYNDYHLSEREVV